MLSESVSCALVHSGREKTLETLVCNGYAECRKEDQEVSIDASI